MNNYNIIPIDLLYQMIYNYGPSLKYELSRTTYPIYELERKGEVEIEENRMKLFNKHFSSATPSRKVINKLKKYIGNDKVLEIDAYLGLWSYLLFEEGIDIIPTNTQNHSLLSFINIEKINPIDAIYKYNDRKILLTVWPHYKRSYENLNEIIKNFSGDRLILIADKTNGNKIINEITNGIQTILKELKREKIEYKWIVVDEYHIPKWLDIKYKIYLLEKQDL